MTINVNIDIDPRIELKARRTIDGNILILDHEDMDIVIMTPYWVSLQKFLKDLHDRLRDILGFSKWRPLTKQKQKSSTTA